MKQPTIHQGKLHNGCTIKCLALSIFTSSSKSTTCCSSSLIRAFFRSLAVWAAPLFFSFLRSAFSSGLRCVRRCRLRAWGRTALAPSGLAPCWPGTMTGRARPAGAPATAAGWPDRRSTLGAPAARLCAHRILNTRLLNCLSYGK